MKRFVTLLTGLVLLGPLLTALPGVRPYVALFTARTMWAAALVKYVDTGATGTADGDTWTDAYTTMFDAEALNLNLTDDGGDTLTIYCRASTAAVDTTCVNWIGWTLAAANYVSVEGVDGTYVLHNNDSSANGALYINEDHLRFTGITVRSTTSGTNARCGVYTTAIPANADIRFTNCRFEGVSSGTGANYGISAWDSDTTMKIVNCIFRGFTRTDADDTGFVGLKVSGAAVTAYNCTIYGNRYGCLQVTSGSLTLKNCVIFNNYDDFSGTITADYCASDDADASTWTNGQAFTAEATDWNKVFTDYTTNDVTLKSYTTPPCCVGVGVDDPGSGLYSDDIVGTARSSVWDIGAYENTGGGGGSSLPVFRHHYRSME